VKYFFYQLWQTAIKRALLCSIWQSAITDFAHEFKFQPKTYYRSIVTNRFPQKSVEIELTDMLLCSDAGLLSIRQLDETLKLTKQFIDA